MDCCAANSLPRKSAVDAYQNAALTLAGISPGASAFFLARGQFSMIDAILAVLAQTGPGAISIWPRTVSVVKGDILSRLMIDPLITSARMIIATGDDLKNQNLVSEWIGRFGVGSIRHMCTHCKIATVEAGGMRLLLRGSLNIAIDGSCAR